MSKIFLGLIFSFSATTVFAQAFKAKDPQVLLIEGKAFITQADGKRVLAKKKQILKERATIETEQNSWLYLSIAKNEKVLLGPSSKINLPVIGVEDGEVERVELEQGQMRVVNLTSHPRLILTPLTRDAYSEGDLVFDYDAKKPAVKLSVLDGHAVFRGEENEDLAALSSNEEASFIGKMENDTLVVDVLLQGRKVVRGRLTDKSNVTPETRQHWTEALTKFEKAHRTASAKEEKEKNVAGAICKKPQGKMDQCAWTCVNNPKSEKTRCRTDLPKVKCVRTRCDANGNWSDPLELIPQQSACSAKTAVRRCDY